MAQCPRASLSVYILLPLHDTVNPNLCFLQKLKIKASVWARDPKNLALTETKFEKESKTFIRWLNVHVHHYPYTLLQLHDTINPNLCFLQKLKIKARDQKRLNLALIETAVRRSGSSNSQNPNLQSRHHKFA